MLEADRAENICSKKRLPFAPFYAILRKEQMFYARKGGCFMEEAKQLWREVRLHCPNCGRYLHGNLRADGSARLKCQSCGLIIVRTVKSRRRCELQLLAVENKIEKGRGMTTMRHEN